MSRALVLAATAAVLIASPATAQSSPLVGRYAMSVEPEPGSVCPASQATVEILSISGESIEVDLDHVRFTGRYDPRMQTFVGHIPFPDAAHQVRVDGGFSPGPGVTNLIMTVEFPPDRPCKALLSGTIPATGASSAQASTPPAPVLGSAPSAPVSSGPPVFGVAPNGDPVDYGSGTAPPQRGMGPIRDGKLLGWIGVLAFLLGLVIRIVRRKPTAAAAPAPAPEPKPVVDPPAAEPEPAAEPAKPAKKPARRKPAAKPRPTEEEDELGDG